MENIVDVFFSLPNLMRTPTRPPESIGDRCQKTIFSDQKKVRIKRKFSRIKKKKSLACTERKESSASGPPGPLVLWSPWSSDPQVLLYLHHICTSITLWKATIPCFPHCNYDLKFIPAPHLQHHYTAKSNDRYILTNLIMDYLVYFVLIILWLLIPLGMFFLFFCDPSLSSSHQ